MAEALVVIGLVSSIVQFVDFGTEIIRRLEEFTSNVGDVPKTFRSMQAQLPLIIDALERTRAQGDAGRISDKSAHALKPVIDDTLERVKFLAHILDKAIPATDASNLQKRLKALKSLAYDKNVQGCIDRLQGNIHTLIFHQTTSHSDICDKLAQELKRLSLPSSSTTEKYTFGLNLGNAPHIEEELFVGRETELRQLREWLLPQGDLSSQSVVALSGLGGVGKTQLAIKFAKQSHYNYSSTLWLNAKNEVTLKQAFIAFSRLILKVDQSQTVEDNVGEDQIVMQMRRWLSEPGNNRWLLIFDNYDDPSFSGLSDSTGYDIRNFFPHSFQGSILITTRSKKLVFAKILCLQKLESLQQSVAILASRSGRDLERDPDAIKLAIRLDGLPLALATAGAYLSQTADGCSEYLEAYESGWNDLTEDADCLFEYEDRTLYSTWNLSLKQIQVVNSEAAELLRLMAYFNNQDIWYDLLKAGVDDGPPWFFSIVRTRARFNQAMTKLLDYSLVEAQSGSYSLHRCVHDWTLEVLNEQKDPGLYSLATCCLARNVLDDQGPQSWLVNRRLLPHAVRLEYSQFRDLALQISPTPEYLDDLDTLGSLCRDQGKMTEAEQVYQRALMGKEKTLGPEHTSTLDTVDNLAILYSDNGYGDEDKMIKSEQMHQRVVMGYEKALGPEHSLTLSMIERLGTVYWYQGKLMEAEQMYQRVLTGMEKTVGREHSLTLTTVNNLAAVYGTQGRMAEAEQMYQKVLTGWEKLLGPENTSTLTAINNLGNLYREQGRLAEAEQMCQRALMGQEKTLGLEHKVTLYTVKSLANVYRDQGRTVEAAQMYRRALTGYEKMLGPEHPSTIFSLNDLYATLSQLGWDQNLQSEEVAINRLKVLNELIELASKWASTFVLYGDLGKALLQNSDELNAQIAFQQPIFLEDGIWVHNAMCDVCGLTITCAMKRFVCKRCRDTDLCGECFQRHETGIKELSTCTEHPFLEILSEGLSGSAKIPSVRETARDIWLQKLRKEYSKAALDDRDLVVKSKDLSREGSPELSGHFSVG